MYSWLLPAVKAVLPHIGTIIATALPVFKSRKLNENAATQEALLQRQITELQTAATQNALQLKELAQQMEQILITLERDVQLADRRHLLTSLLSGLALALSIIAIALWWFARA